jgi:hypothetical protein
MQTLRSAPVPLLCGIVLLLLACPLGCPLAFAAPRAPKVHTVTLGPPRRVPYTPPEATLDTKSDDSSTLRIRSLDVDGNQKEWTLGEVHDVTDRTFVVRRALRINDSLPNEAPRWTWQPGSWLMVDRATGRITALHLPAYDPQVSDVVWFRDYAAYCGITTTAKGGLVAVIAELGARKPVVQKLLAPAPPPVTAHSACAPAIWQRSPMRATLQPAGGAAVTYDVVGTSSLIEENDPSDE